MFIVFVRKAQQKYYHFFLHRSIIVSLNFHLDFLLNFLSYE